MITISVIISLLYSGLILYFVKGFDQVKTYKNKNSDPQTNFTLIIPFRNEAHNLTSLLNSLEQLNYSVDQFEILLINDASEDDFENIINDFKSKTKLDLQLYHSVRKSNSPKKDAIETGIKISKYNWIITTDADCNFTVNWLKTLDTFIQTANPKMVVAPVAFQVKSKLLYQFQNLDFLALQGSTIGGFGIHKPFLCNGANLCYNKDAFVKVKGFTGNDNIASGDDIFLLEKMICEYPGEVKYLKSYEAIVTTQAQDKLSGLIQQRIRWASKTSAYTNSFGKLTGFLIFTANTYLLALFILAVMNNISWQHFGLYFLIKFNVDFLLLYKTSQFFKQTEALRSYVISSVLYPFFTVIIGLLSLKKGYQWKGRRFDQ